ncbi:hypothetical protein CesoFtcFv8_016984 [Champsocephalus esox]|uniref:Mesothelin-like protein n=1 Tax=Champsocephalus esox TaxID=159716 RepID=A0AAN8GNL7_9TELE|nr:hypothetical protein CesoFtcFv8_016984 [Champsocephalus esox]
MASMDREQQQAVYTHFIRPFLSRNDSSDPGCVSFNRGSKEWLQGNFGNFSGFATLQDLQALNSNISTVEVAYLLTVSQLAQLAASPSHLKTKMDVTNIMKVINPVNFGAFFDIVSPAIETHPANFTVEVKSAFLQEVYDRGNLSSPAISDTEFLLWLRRLSPLLVNLSPSLVTSLFNIGKKRGCNSSEKIITLLDTQRLTLSSNTQREIYTNILQSLQAPTVIQQIFVQKIISLDQSAASVVQNVPDAMATEIPSSSLVFSGPVDISKINKKTWTGEQAAMFFESLGETDFDTEKLNPTVLQGFTCNTVRKMKKKRVRGLIHSCRPRKGRAKVKLEETQLMCMYNQLKGNLSQDFAEYPSDMLIYLNIKDVQGANCRSYFTALGAADFTVASSVLNKDSGLFSEAQNCLGISGVKLNGGDVEVLGNMVCTLDSSYIENSDSLILEKLKVCKDLSASQVAAMEKLLQSGKTKYGDVTTWNAKTLVDLGELPLYLTENFWGQFKSKTKKRFLKTFMPKQRKKKVRKSKLKKLFKHISARKTKRGADCTVGNITQVTVSDNAFPFGYEVTQFNLCLDIPVLKDRLDSICQKVDDSDFQTVILRKLNEAYPLGVPEEKVLLLGSVSRVATLNDISKWTITKVDTLAELLKTEDGSWEAAQSKAIITKYLETPGNSLGATEINSIDSNLCSLDISSLEKIKPDSIRNSKPLNLASCSTEQQKVLYEISKISFVSQSSNPTTYYNLIRPYLGGAPLTDVVELSKQDIHMDLNTFQSLDPNVISKLTAADVKALVGANLPDLKVFENATAVETWRNLLTQAELDTLDVGLTTSRVPLTTTPPNPVPVKTTKGKATMANTVKTTPVNATSGGAQLAKHPTSMFLAALLTAVLLQLLQ